MCMLFCMGNKKHNFLKLYALELTKRQWVFEMSEDPNHIQRMEMVDTRFFFLRFSLMNKLNLKENEILIFFGFNR